MFDICHSLIIVKSIKLFLGNVLKSITFTIKMGREIMSILPKKNELGFYEIRLESNWRAWCEPCWKDACGSWGSRPRVEWFQLFFIWIGEKGIAGEKLCQVL